MDKQRSSENFQRDGRREGATLWKLIIITAEQSELGTELDLNIHLWRSRRHFVGITSSLLKPSLEIILKNKVSMRADLGLNLLVPHIISSFFKRL